MKKVSIRSFQLKPYEYLKDLPIMLTRYGEDVAVIQTAKQLRDSSSRAEHLVVDQKAEVSKSSYPAEWSDKPLPGYKFVSFVGKYKRE